MKVSQESRLQSTLCTQGRWQAGAPFYIKAPAFRWSARSRLHLRRRRLCCEASLILPNISSFAALFSTRELPISDVPNCGKDRAYPILGLAVHIFDLYFERALGDLRDTHLSPAFTVVCHDARPLIGRQAVFLLDTRIFFNLPTLLRRYL